MFSSTFSLFLRRSLVLISALAIISCAEVDSEDLRSSGFHADISVSAEGNGQSAVRVRLSTGSSIDADEIVLTGEDQLRATAVGISRTLSLDTGGYSAAFNGDAGGAEYVVSLTRSGNDTDMPDSRVTLPQAFDIDAPDTNARFGSNEVFSVVWGAGSSDPVSIRYSGSCVSANDGEKFLFAREYSVADTGIHTVPVSAVLNSFGNQAEFNTAIPCPVEISVERKSVGILDPNYGQGGSISARQTRKLNVTVIP